MNTRRDQIEEMLADGRRAEQRVMGALKLRHDKLTAATTFYQDTMALVSPLFFSSLLLSSPELSDTKVREP